MITFAEINELYQSMSKDFIKRNPVLEDWIFTWNPRLNTTMGRMCVNRRENKKWIELSIKVVELNLTAPNFLDTVTTGYANLTVKNMQSDMNLEG